MDAKSRAAGSWTTRYAISAAFVCAALCAGGVYSALQLPPSVFPRTDFQRGVILVANAGISPPPRPFIELSLDEYRRVLDVNHIGTLLGLRAAIPAILASGGGSSVTISSVGGLQGVPGMAPYTSSKFAVRGLTRVAGGGWRLEQG